MEAPGGFEPPHRSFADCSLSHLGTAPRWHYNEAGYPTQPDGRPSPSPQSSPSRGRGTEESIGAAELTADFTGAAGSRPASEEGKPKLTESSREFRKVSASERRGWGAAGGVEAGSSAAPIDYFFFGRMGSSRLSEEGPSGGGT